MTQAETAYQSHTVEDRNQLVIQELPTVYYIAVRIRERLPQHVELDDLVSAGVLGLLEASRNFDSSKNAQFKTFAKFRIRGAILDSLRDVDWGSRSLRKRGREITDAIATLQGKFGRQPTEEEIADEMELDIGRLRKIMANLDALNISGQERVATSERTESLDLIESAPNLHDPDPFDLCLQGEMKEHLAEAISHLSEREQLILSLYYREELTMKEIAEIVGVALSRVSQIRQAAVVKLKQALAHLNSRPIPPPTLVSAGGPYGLS
jgi:RNA polymerase sigma factor for flagellar operon FliA